MQTKTCDSYFIGIYKVISHGLTGCLSIFFEKVLRPSVTLLGYHSIFMFALFIRMIWSFSPIPTPASFLLSESRVFLLLYRMIFLVIDLIMKKITKYEQKKYYPVMENTDEDIFILTEEEVKILRERSALSGLPGNTEIKNEIVNSFINVSGDKIIVYFDLNNFKAYNDNYGFIKGDKVIKTVAGKIKEINKGFSGHVGGDDFVAIMEENEFDSFARDLLAFFENKLRDFYDAVDYERGCIISFDRAGNRNFYPLMGGTLVAFKNRGQFSTPESVGEFAAQLKNAAKLKAEYFTGNSVIFKSNGDDITPLKSIINDQKIPLNLRRGIIESLGELKDFSYESIIMEVLNSKEAEHFIKKSALYALGKLRAKETVLEIRKYLSHPSAHLRMRAVEALGEVGIPDTGILDAFNDRNYYVRKAAVIAAGRTGDTKYIPALKKKLEDKTLGNFAFVSLASLGDKGVLENISAFAKSGTVQPETRIKALTILSANENYLSPKIIYEIFENIEIEPPGFIVEALIAASKVISGATAVFSPREFRDIFSLCEHNSWRVRRAVCEFASRSGRDEAQTVVKRLCFDSNTSVRVKAVESLAFFTGKSAFIAKLFNDPDEVIRAAAVSTIKFMDIPEKQLPGIIEKLRLHLKDPSHEVAENSARSILSLLGNYNC